MFKYILRYMQWNDRNGDWLTATKEEAPYILATLKDWVANNGTELTPRIQGYMNFLTKLIEEMGSEVL